MIFSESWLREWVNTKLDTQDLMDELTMAGLEAEGSDPVAREFSGIIVGEVESVESHPNADKLSVCKVNDGAKSYQVVCGATNVRQGIKVPFANIGAEIHTGEDKPFQIKSAKLRGIESKGMICSSEELGLEEKSEGIMVLPNEAPLGVDVRNYLQLNDTSIELTLTPNRGDCLGILGLAREVGVISGHPVTEPEIPPVASTINDELPIRISAKDGCPRYLGRIIRNVNLKSESPLWMQEKLRRSGLRSIDPIVDVTNFVLMELGQPMHAFDYSKLKGHINVRMAKKNEKLILLDGKEVDLSPEIMLIADKNKPVAMAGIMGGLETSVTDSTKDVFLECAFFSPLTVAGKARRYGMQTDASHRYERGVDYNLQHKAMERATLLLLEIVGGEAGPITEAVGNLPKPVQVELNIGTVSRTLGVDVARKEIIDILSKLGFVISSKNKDSVMVDVPSFRFDVTLEADLIEEIARIYGYNKVPSTTRFGGRDFVSRSEALVPLERIRHQLVGLGYQEVITYSFIDPELSELVCEENIQTVSLENPISEEMSVMRASLLPGLLQTAQYNANRQQYRIRLFETGMVFTGKAGDYEQIDRIAGLISGNRYPQNWNNENDIADFYDLKGDVESILNLGGHKQHFRYQAAEFGCFHPGQCARIESREGDLLGHAGALHPAIARKLELDTEAFLFELDLEAVQKGELSRAGLLSRYPEVNRDLAFVIDDSIVAEEILALVRDNAGEYLTSLRIFDVYQGDAIQKGKKSVALGLTWQHPSRTLSDDEISNIIGSCVNVLQEQFNANLRN